MIPSDQRKFTENFYNKVAKTFGDRPSSTIKDLFIRESELDFFIKEISHYQKITGKDSLKILDIGCGNGTLLKKLSQIFPSSELFGVEMSPGLWEIAKNGLSSSLHKIILADVTSDEISSIPLNYFDFCITERVLINIFHKSSRKILLENISRFLLPGGIYLLSESFKSSLRELNKARLEMKLPEISESLQNSYLSDHELSYLQKFGLTEINGLLPQNFLSTHFYLTRVLHPIIRPPKARVEATQFVKFFDQALGPAIGNFSPILFKVFKKDDKKN